MKKGTYKVTTNVHCISTDVHLSNGDTIEILQIGQFQDQSVRFRGQKDGQFFDFIVSDDEAFNRIFTNQNK